MSFEAEEVARTDCFLCRPAGKLLANVGQQFLTMAGLGPLTDCYAIVATLSHESKGQEAPPSLTRDLANYASSVQQILAHKFGSCVLTEHGKLPLCNAGGSHCFHPHFLLFPGVADPLNRFSEYFGFPGEKFGTLFEALSFAATLSNYLLVSARSNDYTVFQADQGLPRQFARLIIAEHLDTPDLASWQTFPNADWSIRNAELLRAVLREAVQKGAL